MLISIVIGCILRSIYLTQENERLNTLNIQYEHNQRELLEQVSNKNDSLLYLQLSYDQLSNINAELAYKIDKLANDNKIQAKQLSMYQSMSTALNIIDTVEVILRDSIKCDFKAHSELNAFTVIDVSYEAGKCVIEARIEDEYEIGVAYIRKYRNKRKNFFDRLFHWDWQKINEPKIIIKHANEYNTIKNVTIVDLGDKD